MPQVEDFNTNWATESQAGQISVNSKFLLKTNINSHQIYTPTSYYIISFSNIVQIAIHKDRAWHTH